MHTSEQQTEAMHRTSCANVVAIPVNPEYGQAMPAESKTPDMLYRAATVAAALLLLAGAAAA